MKKNSIEWQKQSNLQNCFSRKSTKICKFQMLVTKIQLSKENKHFRKHTKWDFTFEVCII
jgi:hypothetical protein